MRGGERSCQAGGVAWAKRVKGRPKERKKDFAAKMTGLYKEGQLGQGQPSPIIGLESLG